MKQIKYEFFKGLILFKVPTNEQASNIGPYLNFIKFFIPKVFLRL